MEGLEHPTRDFSLAIDIGGSKAAYTIIDTQGNRLIPIENQAIPFDDRNIADPQKMIAQMLPFVEQARGLPGVFHGIGLSVCGNIDIDSGMAVLVPNLHWRYLPFGQMVMEAFQCPVYAATDVRMAVLAEALWGAARKVRYFAWATIGTGYGGYLFLDGKLYAGTHGFAGNFGHNTWDEANGYPCGCGRRGCVETFVAGPAIARAGQKALEERRSPLLEQLAGEGPVTSALVFQAEAAGDPASRDIIEEVIRLVAINLGGLVNVLDLDMIVMGGGVVHGSPDFIPRLSRRIRDFMMTEEAQRDLVIAKESFPNSALQGAGAEVFIRKGILTI